MIRVSSFGLCKETYFNELLARTERLMPFEWREVKIKKLPGQRPAKLLPEEQKFLEQNKSFVILDRGGKALDDEKFYRFCFSQSERHFVIGPAFGFHPEFIAKAEASLSLSSLTLTHGLAQTLLAESLYRVACTLKNHPFVK